MDQNGGTLRFKVTMLQLVPDSASSVGVTHMAYMYLR